MHFDFCFMTKGENDLVYVLVVKDDMSGYVWLQPKKATHAESTADTLLQWFAAFGASQVWISDKGAHFKNEIIAFLRDMLRADHRSTSDYCPWTNRSVEVVFASYFVLPEHFCQNLCSR